MPAGVAAEGEGCNGVIVLGKSGGKNVTLDLDALLRGRMLIQANSGKGKSWLLRRLAEQLFGKVQVIIIDPEGEFATLREKFGFVLVGKGGETPADPRSAALVAHKLLELKASAVCDLYEMKPSQRHEWVQKFVDALIDAPKNLWHPCVIMVDEAHVFCPEKGAGESVAAEAIIGLGTRGRKRGFAIIPATQRLGKLRKDLAAELLNVMIGGTFIDIDRKRAADALGIYGKDQHKFFDEIKVLERGTFFALGPAICDERILVKVGDVETSHPEAGSAKHAAEPPPAPDKVKAMLPKLADLPKTAEEKARTEAELKSEIRSLKAQLRTAPTATKEVKVADPKAIERAVASAVKKYSPLRTLLEEAVKVIVKVNAIGFEETSLKPEQISAALEATAKEIAKLAKANLSTRQQGFEKLKSETNRLLLQMKKFLDNEDLRVDLNVVRNEPVTVTPPRAQHPVRERVEGDLNLKAGARKMLTILAQWHPEARTREQLGALAGFSSSGGTFGDYLSKLRLNGFIHENGNGISITEDGLANAGDVPELPSTTEELVAMWKPKFKAGVGKMLDHLVADYPGYVDRETLGEATGYAASGGTFGDYLSQLRRARLIEESGGSVRAAESLFP